MEASAQDEVDSLCLCRVPLVRRNSSCWILVGMDAVVIALGSLDVVFIFSNVVACVFWFAFPFTVLGSQKVKKKERLFDAALRDTNPNPVPNSLGYEHAYKHGIGASQPSCNIKATQLRE